MITMKIPALARNPREALRSIAPGERITYHVGFLANDRKGSVTAGGLAWELYEEGRVILVQKRALNYDAQDHPRVFMYVAIGR